MAINMSDTNLQNQDDESSKDVKGPAGQKVGGSTVPERRDRASLAELDLFKFMPHRKTDDADSDDDTDPNGVAAVSESTDTSTDTVAIAEPVVVTDNESGSVDEENVATGTTDADANDADVAVAATDVTDPTADTADTADTTDTNESDDDENLDPEEIAKRKHRRHVKIMRGIVTPVLGVLAIIAFVFGGLNATIWKPNPHVTVSTGTLSTNYVVTDPGVLALADNTVDISATAASGDQVCIAVTSARDATGWLSGQKYTRVNGLATWQNFTTQTSSTKDSGDTGTVAFADSDMWEQVSCNNDKTTLQWKGDGGDRVILVSAQGADPKANTKLDFTMSWTRATVPNFAMPFFFVGGLLTVMAILAATLFSLEGHRRRKRKTLENAHVTALTEEEMLDQDGKPHWMHAGSEPPSPERSRRRERRERRRRHHSHRREAVEEELREEREAEGPEVLDVTSVNLLQQNTPAVSTDELQEYFARLAAENAANAEAADTAVDTDGADIATNNDANPGNDDTDGMKEAK